MNPNPVPGLAQGSFQEEPNIVDLPPTQHLSETDILRLAQQAEAQWPEHAQTCEICRGVLRVARDEEPAKRNLTTFLAMVKAQAAAIERQQQPSFWKELRAIFSLSGMRWATAFSAVLLVGLGVVWLRAGSQATQLSASLSTTPAVVSFGADAFEHKVQALRSFYETVKSDQPADLQAINQGVEEYKQQIGTLKREELNERQRAEVANLTTRVAAVLQIRQQELVGKDATVAVRETASPTSTPAALLTGDSRRAADLYADVGASYARENGKPGAIEATPANVAPRVSFRAIQSGWEQVEVVSISNDKLVVRDLHPKRAPQERAALNKVLQDFQLKSELPVTFRSGGEEINFPKTASMQATSTPRVN